MQYTNNRSVIDILSLDPSNPSDWDILQESYVTVDIDKVKIDGNEFTNYGQYQFVWEKTYAKSPSRSLGGAMGSLNSLSTFLTPHLILDFSVMSIDDYRRIMQLHYESNEFLVECYDHIYNKRIAVKMYFATEQMAKLHIINRKRIKADGSWENFLLLAGVKEYSVELIGTNNDLDYVSLRYRYVEPNSHPKDEKGDFLYPSGAPVPDQAEDDVYVGEDILVGQNVSFVDTPPSSEYKFKHWVDESGTTYNNEKSITLNGNKVLFAVWEMTTKSTLGFNYGIAKPKATIDPSSGEAKIVYSKEVDNGLAIGSLPEYETPVVEYQGAEYEPYRNGQWYKIPYANAESLVTAETPYWGNHDSTVFLVFEKVVFSLEYETNDATTSFPTQSAHYQDPVYLPVLARTGYVFKGWWEDPEFKKVFNGNMPPKDTKIYAKWEKEDS